VEVVGTSTAPETAETVGTMDDRDDSGAGEDDADKDFSLRECRPFRHSSSRTGALLKGDVDHGYFGSPEGRGPEVHEIVR
jgi:hypothetical protein